MKGLTILSGYQVRKVGIVISAIGIATMIAEKISGFIIIHQFSAQQHYWICLWILLLGFYLIANSKVKHEDDRVKQIRAKALQISYTYLTAVLLSITLLATTVLYGKVNFDASVLLVVVAASLILFLLTFHIGLYFDFLWDYDDKGLWANWKNISANKWGLLAYLAICIILTAVVFLI